MGWLPTLTHTPTYGGSVTPCHSCCCCPPGLFFSWQTIECISFISVVEIKVHFWVLLFVDIARRQVGLWPQPLYGLGYGFGFARDFWRTRLEDLSQLYWVHYRENYGPSCLDGIWWNCVVDPSKGQLHVHCSCVIPGRQDLVKIRWMRNWKTFPYHYTSLWMEFVGIGRSFLRDRVAPLVASRMDWSLGALDM